MDYPNIYLEKRNKLVILLHTSKYLLVMFGKRKKSPCIGRPSENPLYRKAKTLENFPTRQSEYSNITNMYINKTIKANIFRTVKTNNGHLTN